MITITKSPAKDKIDKNIIAFIIAHYLKITLKIKLEKTALIYNRRFLSPSSRLTEE